MKTLHHEIVSEEMVWLWYFDELGSKHFKELLEKEARDFIKSLTQSPDVAASRPTVTQVDPEK